MKKTSVVSCVALLFLMLFSSALSNDEPTKEQLDMLEGLIKRAQEDNRAELAKKSLLDLPVNTRMEVVRDVLLQVYTYFSKYKMRRSSVSFGIYWMFC